LLEALYDQGEMPYRDADLRAPCTLCRKQFACRDMERVDFGTQYRCDKCRREWDEIDRRRRWKYSLLRQILRLVFLNKWD
jgi:hypothetical protein